MTVTRVVKLNFNAYLLSKLSEAAECDDVSTGPASNLQHIVQLQPIGLFVPAPFQD